MTRFECSNCSRSFSSNASLKQHTKSKHSSQKSDESPIKKYVIITLILGIIIFLSMSVYSSGKGPGRYDEFVSCLNEKGVVVYGNNHCSYTVQQLNFFEKSQTELNYIKCTDNEALCDEKGIKITPTWEYKGNFYSQVQSFDTLAAITGCEYK